MHDKAMTIARVCKAIGERDFARAKRTISEEYPFEVRRKSGRKYSEFESVTTFLSDGFVDRYSGSRLVNPGVLRLIGAEVPDVFPFHKNWRMEETHIAFWELFPTVDHVVPIARGGADEPANWATTSMFRNSAKSNALLEEVG